MPRSRLNSLALVFAIGGCLLSSIPAITAETPWLEVHSVHFTVITDAGEKRGREVALRFEQMRSVFALLLTKDRLNQSVPLTILAFKNDKSYYQLAPPRQGQPIDVPGFLLPGEDQNYIVLNLFEDDAWRAIAHDFATMLLNYNYPPAQAWFDEGLAEYFSSIRLDNKQVELGGDPELLPSVNEDLLGNRRDAHPPKSLAELLGGAQVWLSLPDLFAMKHDTTTHNQGARHTLYYAESWIVMHYLLHEKKLPETGAYFDLILNQHLSVEEAIQKAYGMSSAQMEQAVKDYFHAQSALQAAVGAARQTNADTAANASGQTLRFPAPVGPDDTVINSKSIPEADALALAADVAVRIPERRDAALQQLRALATKPTAADKKFEAKNQEKHPTEDPDQLPNNAMGSPLAHRILAWDQIQHGQFDEATTHIADALALNPRDMWLRYYLAVLKYRVAQAKHTDIQGLPNMMLDLRAVLDWYPELAGAYDLLGVARNEGGSSLAAMQSERAAIGLSPRNELYNYHLAQIYVASKKWEASQALLDRLKGSSSPQIATLARELMEKAGVERKYGIPLGTAAMPQAKLAPQKSPFDVLEEDAAKRAEAEKASPSATSQDKRSTKFVHGRLLAIDCSNAPAAILTVTAAGDTLKLHASDYRSLVLIGADDFSCDWRDRQVTVNYNPVGAKDGELVSLEVR
jgi:tetratricopeptide (TPR) repeat protein